MSKAKEWTPYKAALRRKKIAEVKRIKQEMYIKEMNKKANKVSTQQGEG